MIECLHRESAAGGHKSTGSLADFTAVVYSGENQLRNRR